MTIIMCSIKLSFNVAQAKEHYSIHCTGICKKYPSWPFLPAYTIYCRDSGSNSNIRKSAHGTCLGYEALVNSTTPNRGNDIAKTWAICLRLPVHEMFVVIIKANTNLRDINEHMV